MAADEARAERIRDLKNAHPELTWRRIAEHVGVSERAAVDWQKTGGISYENAGKLAELFPETTLDQIWRGETPHLMGQLSNNGSAGADTDLERRLTAVEMTLSELVAEVRKLNKTVAAQTPEIRSIQRELAASRTRKTTRRKSS